jgi:hypothetical protein
MDKPRWIRSTQISPDYTLPEPMLARRAVEMQQLLVAAKPASAALALKALREAFPESSLDERVRVVARTLH